jgi:hypothetical protein
MGALILASALDRSVMQYGTPFLPPCRVRPPPTLAYPNRRHRTRSGPKKDTPLKRELRREREGLRVPRRRERQRRCRFALLTLRCPDRGIRFAPDSPLEEAVSSEPVSESQNSLLAGKIQGILFFRASEAHHLPEMQQQSQGVMAEFPTDRNRELFRS